MPVSLDTAYEASRAIGEMQRLAVLDQLWTGVLAEERPLADDEVQTLIRICRDLEAGITRLVEYGELARRIVEENPEEIQEPYQTILADERIDQRQRTYLAEKVDAAGGLQGYVQAAGQLLEERAPQEQEALREKRNLLENGEYTPGDYSKEFRCGVYASGTCLGLGAMMTVGGAVAGAAITLWSLGFAWYEDC